MNKSNSRLRAFYNKVSGALKLKLEKTLDWASRNPGKMTGVTLLPGDIAMLASGLWFNNWGRIGGASLFLAGDIPLTIWGDKKNNEHTDTYEDPQDMPFWSRMAEHWKFWKHPWEFQASIGLAPSIVIFLFAGPDTVSEAGEIANADIMISSDSFRPGEFVFGIMGVLGLSILYIKEEAQNNLEQGTEVAKRGFQSLKKEFNALADYTKRRLDDVLEHGVSLNTAKTVWNNTISDISRAGPTVVAAKVFAVSLVPYAIEGMLRQDWGIVTTAVTFGAACFFMAQTSKRTQSAQAEISSPAI